MRTARLFGYQQLHEGAVLITRQCRTVNVVRGREQVSELLSALRGEDAQAVLSRYASGVRPGEAASEAPARQQNSRKNMSRYPSAAAGATRTGDTECMAVRSSRNM